jgi:hypothetical protein
LFWTLAIASGQQREIGDYSGPEVLLGEIAMMSPKPVSGCLRVSDHPANRASVEEICEAWRELPTRNLGQLCKRLRINWMSDRDIVWAICGLVGIALASAIVLALA